MPTVYSMIKRNPVFHLMLPKSRFEMYSIKIKTLTRKDRSLHPSMQHTRVGAI